MVDKVHPRNHYTPKPESGLKGLRSSGARDDKRAQLLHITAKICETIAVVAELCAAEVTADTDLRGLPGVDSLLITECVGALEQTFHVTIDENSLVYVFRPSELALVIWAALDEGSKSSRSSEHG
jgi:acyl carrier protein